MGRKAKSRLIYICVCMLLVNVIVYFGGRSTVAIEPKIPLAQAFYNINDWKVVGENTLEQDIVEALDLDDYLYRTYINEQNKVSLYIGYYRTTSKVGAAHSPLVCFPGQGWEISMPKQISMRLNNGKIKVEKLITKKGVRRELLIYWFQSYDMTASGTFLQKIQNFGPE